ncbi:hypothetical protein ACHAWO_002419 [Cyclotella atomus]|uniref:MYND-type domain-containing protein n=1 Tax=Cyclotella atomus TaxID=382360 RepID=A0ABD3PGG1_9STRA
MTRWPNPTRPLVWLRERGHEDMLLLVEVSTNLVLQRTNCPPPTPTNHSSSRWSARSPRQLYRLQDNPTEIRQRLHHRPRHANLLQMTPSGLLAVKFVCRLVCLDCLEEIVKDTCIESNVGQESSNLHNVFAMEVIKAQGPVTCLRDGQGLCVLTTPDHKTLSAYDLNGIWENFGAFQAMVGVFFQEFGSSSSRLQFMETTRSTVLGKESQIRSKVGKKCDCPGCDRVHGDKVESSGDETKRIRLQDCTGCYDASYCSKTCQHAAKAVLLESISDHVECGIDWYARSFLILIHCGSLNPSC